MNPAVLQMSAPGTILAPFYDGAMQLLLVPQDWLAVLALGLLCGSLAAVFVLMSLLTAQVLSLRSSASRVAIRAAGGGVFVAGLVMLGWRWQQLALPLP